MSISSLLGLKCEDAASYCNKSEYQEASFSDKVKLRLHLFFCKPCKDYNHKNNKLSQLIKEADLKSCTEEEKNLLRQRMAAQSETFK